MRDSPEQPRAVTTRVCPVVRSSEGTYDWRYGDGGTAVQVIRRLVCNRTGWIIGLLGLSAAAGVAVGFVLGLTRPRAAGGPDAAPEVAIGEGEASWTECRRG